MSKSTSPPSEPSLLASNNPTGGLQWTQKDYDLALEEGWAMMHWSSIGWHIVSVLTRFDTNFQAETHVRAMADKGSRLHKKALAYIAWRIIQDTTD